MESTCHSPKGSSCAAGPWHRAGVRCIPEGWLPQQPPGSLYPSRCPPALLPSKGAELSTPSPLPPCQGHPGIIREGDTEEKGQRLTFSELELVSDDNGLHLKLNGGNFMDTHLCYIALNSYSLLMHISLAAFALCKNMLPEGGVWLGTCLSYLIFNITPCYEEYSQFDRNPDEWLCLPGVKYILGASYVPSVDKDQRNYSQDHSDSVYPWFLRPGKAQQPKGGLSSCSFAPLPMDWELAPHFHSSTQTQWLVQQCKDPGLCLPLTPEVTAPSDALTPSCSTCSSLAQLHALLLVLEQSVKRRWSDLKWMEKKLKGDESILRCSFDTLPLHFLTSLSKLSAGISMGELLATWLRFSLQKCMLAARKIYPLTFSSHFLWKAQVSFSLTMKMCGGERQGEPRLFIKHLNGPIFILHPKLCT